MIVATGNYDDCTNIAGFMEVADAMLAAAGIAGTPAACTDGGM